MRTPWRKPNGGQQLFIFDILVHYFYLTNLNINAEFKTEELESNPPFFDVSFLSALFPPLNVTQDEFKNKRWIHITEKKDQAISYFYRGISTVIAASPCQLKESSCRAIIQVFAKWKGKNPIDVGSGLLQFQNLVQPLLKTIPRDSGKYNSKEYTIDIEKTGELHGKLMLNLKVGYAYSVKSGMMIDAGKGKMFIRKDMTNREMFEASPCLSIRNDPDFRFKPNIPNTCSYAKEDKRQSLAQPEKVEEGSHYEEKKVNACQTKPTVQSQLSSNSQKLSIETLQKNEKYQYLMKADEKSSGTATEDQEERVRKERKTSKKQSIQETEKTAVGGVSQKPKNQGTVMLLPADTGRADMKENIYKCQCNPNSEFNISGNIKSKGKIEVTIEGERDSEGESLLENTYRTRLYEINEIVADVFGDIPNLTLRTATVVVAEDTKSLFDDHACISGLTNDEDLVKSSSKIHLPPSDGPGKKTCITNISKINKSAYLPGGFSLEILPRKVNLLVKEILAQKKKGRDKQEEEDKKREQLEDLRHNQARRLASRSATNLKGVKYPISSHETKENPALVHFDINDTKCTVSIDPKWKYEIQKQEDTGGNTNSPIRLEICKQQRPKSMTDIVSESSFQMKFEAPLQDYGGKEKRHDVTQKRLVELSKDVQAMETDFPNSETGKDKKKK